MKLVGKLIGFRKWKREYQSKKLFNFLDNNYFDKVLEIGSNYNSLKTRVNSNEFVTTNIEKNSFMDVIADVTSLQFKDNEFDLVLCQNVLEHVFDFSKAVKELKRVSKKYVFVAVPFIYPEHEQPDYWRFTEDSLKKLFNLNVKFSYKTMHIANFYSSINILFEKTSKR